MNTNRFSFGKNQKLKGRKNIETLFQNGKAFFVHPIRVVYSIEAFVKPMQSVHIGVGVPKKHIKLAVQRNKIKRQIREAYRPQQHILSQSVQEKQVAIKTMLIYSTAQQHTYSEIENAMQKILQRLQYAIENNK